MDDELEAHLAAHSGLAKDAANVQQADAAHLQQVLQQFRATAFDSGLVDAVQVHGIVGHQPVATRDQFQPEFALAQAGLAGNHHAQAQNVHEHAVHGQAVGEMLGQIGAQQVDDEGRGLARGKHRNLRPLAHRQQGFRRHLALGQHQHRRLQRDDARNAARAVLGTALAEVGDLALAHDLHAVRMDVVQIADQIGTGTRGTHGHFVEAALGRPESRYPLPTQAVAKLLEQDIGADNGWFQANPVRNGAITPRARTAKRRSVGTAALHRYC